MASSMVPARWKLSTPKRIPTSASDRPWGGAAAPRHGGEAEAPVDAERQQRVQDDPRRPGALEDQVEVPESRRQLGQRGALGVERLGTDALEPRRAAPGEAPAP